MLVVLAVSPVTTPLEAGLGKETKAEILMVYLVGEVPVSIAVFLTRSGLNEELTVGEGLDVGVVERVDVDGQSAGMLREISGSSDVTVAEA